MIIYGVIIYICFNSFEVTEVLPEPFGPAMTIRTDLCCFILSFILHFSYSILPFPFYLELLNFQKKSICFFSLTLSFFGNFSHQLREYFISWFFQTCQFVSIYRLLFHICNFIIEQLHSLKKSFFGAKLTNYQQTTKFLLIFLTS